MSGELRDGRQHAFESVVVCVRTFLLDAEGAKLNVHALQLLGVQHDEGPALQLSSWPTAHGTENVSNLKPWPKRLGELDSDDCLDWYHWEQPTSLDAHDSNRRNGVRQG